MNIYMYICIYLLMVYIYMLHIHIGSYKVKGGYTGLQVQSKLLI